jgi:hypothetical protein
VSRKNFSPRIALGLILILLLSSCGGSSAATPPSVTIDTQVAPAATPAAENTPTPEVPELTVSTPEPAIPEMRRLTLEFPPKIRAGDSDIVRLTLEVDTSGNITPTAVINGNVVTGDVIEIPNLYDTHHVIAEARLDMAGMQISPPDLSSQTLLPGQSIRFFWSVRPNEVGMYRGTVWLFLRFVDKVSGEESRNAISAQTVEIDAVNLFGVSAGIVRVAGGVGSVVGAVVGFPFFQDIAKFLFKRRPKRKK